MYILQILSKLFKSYIANLTLPMMLGWIGFRKAAEKLSIFGRNNEKVCEILDGVR